MTSGYRRSSSSPRTDETVQPSQVRWEGPVYAALKSFASASNTSMNAIVNEAVTEYLQQPAQQKKLAEALDKQAEAIRKLSGKE
jgi:hypothetical protein